MKAFDIDIQKIIAYLYCFFIALFMCSCDGGSSNSFTENSDAPETGSVAFKIEWPDEALSEGSATRKRRNSVCEKVEEIDCKVYDEHNAIVGRLDDPWDCGDGKGVIYNVRAGENRTVVIFAIDPQGKVVYRGEERNVNVVSRPLTDDDVIKINLESFIPKLKPTVNNNIEWDGIRGADEYRIIANDEIDKTSDTSYTPDNISESVEIKVYAVDSDEADDYVGAYSEIWTTGPPEVKNAIPTGENVSIDDNTTLTVTFSEAMNDSTLDNAFYVTFLGENGDSINVPGEVSYKNMEAIFTPDSTLDNNTTYNITITSDARDLSGDSLTEDYPWSFTTLDTISPVISSVSPEDGETVDIAVISATFSEPMDVDTINSETFLVNDGAIAGNIKYNNDSTVVTFEPLENLDYDTEYTVSILTDVKDLSGNPLKQPYPWSFTTSSAEELPQITEKNPADNASDIPVSALITAIFNKEMEPSSINKNTFKVKKDGSESNIEGEVDYNNTEMTAAFIPLHSLLDENTLYHVTITADVSDISGNAMQKNHEWSFTTGSDTDTLPPKLIYRIPAENSTDVPVDADVLVVFSKVMDSSTIPTRGDSFRVFAEGTNIAGEIIFGDRNATFSPDQNFSYGTTYTVKLTTDIKDIDGQALESEVIWKFETTESENP